MSRRLPRRHQRFDARRRAAARQQPAGALRIADPATHPVHHHEFQLAGPARHEPGAGVDVEAGGEKVRQHAGPGGRRGHETEKPGMIQPCRVGEHLSHRLHQNLLRGPAAFGRRAAKLFFQPVTELPVPGIRLLQSAEALDEQFRGPLRQSPHGLRRHLQAALFAILHLHPRSFRFESVHSASYSQGPTTLASPLPGDRRHP